MNDKIIFVTLFISRLQAAGRIHGDFEKGFIMAEVMKFNDFKENVVIHIDVCFVYNISLDS